MTHNTRERLVNKFYQFIQPAIDNGFDNPADDEQKRYRDRYAWRADIRDFMLKVINEHERDLINDFRESIEENVTYEALKNNIKFSLVDKIKDKLYE